MTTPQPTPAVGQATPAPTVQVLPTAPPGPVSPVAPPEPPVKIPAGPLLLGIPLLLACLILFLIKIFGPVWGTVIFAGVLALLVIAFLVWRARHRTARGGGRARGGLLGGLGRRVFGGRGRTPGGRTPGSRGLFGGRGGGLRSKLPSWMPGSTRGRPGGLNSRKAAGSGAGSGLWPFRRKNTPANGRNSRNGSGGGGRSRWPFSRPSRTNNNKTPAKNPSPQGQAPSANTPSTKPRGVADAIGRGANPTRPDSGQPAGGNGHTDRPGAARAEGEGTVGSDNSATADARAVGDGSQSSMYGVAEKKFKVAPGAIRSMSAQIRQLARQADQDQPINAVLADQMLATANKLDAMAQLADDLHPEWRRLHHEDIAPVETPVKGAAVQDRADVSRAWDDMSRGY